MEPDDVSLCTICLVALAFTSNQCLIWVLLNHRDVMLQLESWMATPTWLQSLLPIHQWKSLCFCSTKSHLLAAMQKRKDAGTVLAKDTLQHCIQDRLSTGVVFFFYKFRLFISYLWNCREIFTTITNNLKVNTAMSAAGITLWELLRNCQMWTSHSSQVAVMSCCDKLPLTSSASHWLHQLLINGGCTAKMLLCGGPPLLSL